MDPAAAAVHTMVIPADGVNPFLFPSSDLKMPGMTRSALRMKKMRIPMKGWDYVSVAVTFGLN